MSSGSPAGEQPAWGWVVGAGVAVQLRRELFYHESSEEFGQFDHPSVLAQEADTVDQHDVGAGQADIRRRSPSSGLSSAAISS